MRENKNEVMLKLLGLLVQEGIFEEVQLFFLPVGHTHAEIDQRWSVLSRSMKGQDCLTLKDLKEHSHRVFSKSEKACWHSSVDVDEVAEISSIFTSTNSHSFYGLAARISPDNKKRRLLCFRFRKDDKGLPRVQVKEFDSPKERWRGDWVKNEPLPLFKSRISMDTSKLPCVQRQEMKKFEDLEKKVGALHRFLAMGGHEESSSLSRGRIQTLSTKLREAPLWWDNFLREEKEWQANGKPWPSLFTAWDLSLHATQGGFMSYSSFLLKLETGVSVREEEDQREEELEHVLPDHPVEIFLMHKNDRPPPHHRFDPLQDLNIGDVVLCLVDKADSLFGRGWELAQVDLLESTERITVKWLQPRIRRRTGAWDGEWWQRPLGCEWEGDGEDAGELCEWSDTVERSCVVWSGALTSRNTLRVPDQRIVLGQIAAIQRAMEERDGYDMASLATNIRENQTPLLDEAEEEEGEGTDGEDE